MLREKSYRPIKLFHIIGAVILLIGAAVFLLLGHRSHGYNLKENRDRSGRIFPGESDSPFDSAYVVCPLEDYGSPGDCRPWAVRAAPTTLPLVFHTGASTFTLLLHGPDDWISPRCASGPRFFEQPYTDFIVALLRLEGAPSVGGRASLDGHCIGTRPGDVWFLDVGAMVGVHSLGVAAAGFPVVAVEAMPTTADLLRCSKAANSFSHLRVLHVAASNESGIVMCMEAGTHHGIDHVSPSSDACDEHMRVMSIRLDDALAAANFRGVPVPFVSSAAAHNGRSLHYKMLTIGPTVVKIDAEGYEPFVIDGYSRLIGSAHQPMYVILELNGMFVEARSGPGRVISTLLFLVDKGYRMYRGDMSREFTRSYLAGLPDDVSGWGPETPLWECAKTYIFVRRDRSVPKVLIDDLIARGCND